MKICYTDTNSSSAEKIDLCDYLVFHEYNIDSEADSTALIDIIKRQAEQIKFLLKLLENFEPYTIVDIKQYDIIDPNNESCDSVKCNVEGVNYSNGKKMPEKTSHSPNKNRQPPNERPSKDINCKLKGNEETSNQNTAFNKITIPSKTLHTFTCRICSKRFTLKKALDMHLLTHSKPFSNHKFNEIFNNKYSLDVPNTNKHGDLNQHTERSSDDSPSTLMRRQGRGSNSKVAEKQECLAAMSNDSEIIPKLKCYLCGIQFQCNNSLTDHMRIHIGMQMCEACGKAFETPNALSHHKKYAHRKPETRNVCNETFKPHQLKNPLDIWYPCETCPKKFKTRNLLSSHMSRHLSLVLKCSFCPKRFKTNYFLNIHEKNHRQYNYKFKACNRKGELFCDTRDRNRTLDRYQCAECGKSFASKINMLDHIRSHSCR